MLALLPAAAKVGFPLIGNLISGGARPLQNVDKNAIDQMYARQDYLALYHVMYDHQAGNPDAGATTWRTKAREYASQKFQQLQRAGVTIDASRLDQREIDNPNGDPTDTSPGNIRVVSSRPGPDYRAPVTLPAASTAESIADAVTAAATRGDAAARAELTTRLSLGAGAAAAAASQEEQAAAVLPLGIFNKSTGWLVIAVLLVVLFVVFTQVKE